VPVVIISGHGNIEIAVAAIKQGAYDFIEKPFNIDQLMVVIRRGMETSAPAPREPRAEAAAAAEPAEMLGESPAFRALVGQLDKVTQVERSGDAVRPCGLGQGAGGALHPRPFRPRAMAPSSAVSCAAIEPDRMEEVLFGRESRGAAAWTAGPAGRGQYRRDLFRRGRRHAARSRRAKILRVLVDQTFLRVGGSDKVQVDLRVHLLDQPRSRGARSRRAGSAASSTTA
jgi:two-component system nitrogen regulation response regulator NtrX